MENGASTADLAHGVALANAFATANLRSSFPSDLRPPTSDLRPPTSDFRLPTSDFRLLASGPLSLRPNAPMPRVFFHGAFSSRWDKTRNRSTAITYGDGAKGTKRMCPKRVGLFLKHTRQMLGFLR
jgi:hypothetical protein